MSRETLASDHTKVSVAVVADPEELLEHKSYMLTEYQVRITIIKVLMYHLANLESRILSSGTSLFA
jgi:hypothetical protein